MHDFCHGLRHPAGAARFVFSGKIRSNADRNGAIPARRAMFHYPLAMRSRPGVLRHIVRVFIAHIDDGGADFDPFRSGACSPRAVETAMLIAWRSGEGRYCCWFSYSGAYRRRLSTRLARSGESEKAPDTNSDGMTGLDAGKESFYKIAQFHEFIKVGRLAKVSVCTEPGHRFSIDRRG